MLELIIEMGKAEVASDMFTELAESQLALIGGGTGTPALE